VSCGPAGEPEIQSPRQSARVNRAVVGGADRAYVKGPETAAMPEIASSLRSNGIPLMLAAVAGVLVAAASALWAYYGSTVFFDMVVAGLQACF
jgi:hypothetical protein